MKALILSAGLGERLRPLTLHRAKPAVEFLNVPMLGFPYYWLNTLKLDELVFNTHYLPETVRHAAMHVGDPGLPLFFTHEETILGSGGGIWNARAYLDRDEHFAVANGDGVVLCEENDVLAQMLAFHRRRGAIATLLVCPLEGVGTRIPGVWLDNAGEIHGFGKEAPNAYSQCLHYASYMFLSREIWRYLPDGPSNILYDAVIAAMKEGRRAYGFRVDKMHWFETGNIPEYLAATRQCLDYLRGDGPFGRCARDILARFTPGYEATSDLAALQLVDPAATLHAGCHLEGFAVVGRDCELAGGSRLENAVLLPGAKLATGEVLRDGVKGRSSTF